LGNITGLDHIGIPVAVAVRPNSRSVSVSQGKGLDLAQAMASALMEAIEGFHAEVVGEGRRATYREIAEDGAVVDATALRARARRALDVASVSDPGGLVLLAKFHEAGIAVRLWDVTTDVGIAAFLCDIRDESEADPSGLRHFHGAGCHPDRTVALTRALTE